MPNPDSSLEAAKKTAAILNLPWSDVQPIYRALQDGDENGITWLPKSRGRTIWTAHPHYVARLLIALGFGGGANRAHATVTMAQELTPDGRGKYLEEMPAAGIPSPVEAFFFRLLTDTDLADQVAEVVFQADRQSIAFKMQGSAEAVRFVSPNGPRPACAVGITFQGVIYGDVFQRLAAGVSWRFDPCPVEQRAENDGDEAELS